MWFHEDEHWDWTDSQGIELLDDPIIHSLQVELINDELIDDLPVKGTKSIEDAYQRSNMAVCKPESYKEAQQNQTW